ncbi:50S ribosomal protein L23 [[Clostridium] spiroforme]|nr:50S ribosomal protein L23 [Thomasclavelia spiroformis]MBM6880443.1 50S ribosomal protein L23 [Thomasclavelia spiroformis]MBM6930303.1 50S ribosomal protein L23 [Thomasclavelia spiroformis]
MAHITDVLKKPVLTEKSLALQAEENKYTFDVDLNANKTEVKIAVEKMFNVKVEKVNIMNVKPKNKRMGRYEGKTNKRRKAIVKLAEGSSINYFDEEE